MDFARKQLEKYGWSDGKGLGKKEQGMSTALKPKLKFDKSGVGHNVGEQYTNNWWEKLFNNAAENIDVEVKNDQVKMKIRSPDSVELTTKSYSIKELQKNNLAYGSFIKTAKLTPEGIENYDNPAKVSEVTVPFQPLTDDELFAACGGRTAHKGARHGLKLSGKLSRIEKQEKMLLKKMKKVSLTDHNDRDKSVADKKLKKLKKQKESREKYTPLMEDSKESISSDGLKKRKKRKSVSFNDTLTVTKFYTVDLDTSFESEVGSIRDENSNEPNLENTASGSDEGIEQDIENNNNEQLDNHRSFEIAQFKISDLSKAERKKLKKKRKLEAKGNSTTGIFLQKLKNDEEDADQHMEDLDNKDINLKKRKFLDECDHGDNKRGFSKTDFPDRYKNKKSKNKRKKQKKMEEKQINSIVKSLDSICRISESE